MAPTLLPAGPMQSPVMEDRPRSSSVLLGTSAALLALGFGALLLSVWQDPRQSAQARYAPPALAAPTLVPAPLTRAPLEPRAPGGATLRRSRVVPAAAADPEAAGDSRLQQLSAADFDAATSGDAPVLVDYYATWCGPCRLMEPMLESLAKEYEGKVTVYKFDCGEHGSKCQELGIKMLPTFQMYRNGQAVEEMVGTGNDQLMQMFANAA